MIDLVAEAEGRIAEGQCAGSAPRLTVCVVNPDYYRSSGVTVAIRGIFHGSADLPIRWVFVDGLACSADLGDTAWIESDSRHAPVYRLRLMTLNPARLLASLWRLRRVLRKEGVQVLHVHHRRLALLAGWVARTLNIPVVFTSHGPQADNAVFRLAPINRGTGVTAAMCENLRATTGIATITEICNPVITHAPTSGIERIPGVVLCIGRLSHQKNHDTLIRAWSRIDPALHGYRLQLAGEGELRPALERLTRDLGMAETVDFLGFITDIPDRIKASSFLVLASWFEGQGIVTLEGAMAERASLLSNVVGSRDCCPPQGTLPNLFEPADVDGLARGLATWLANPEAVAQEGRRFASYWRGRAEPGQIARAYLAEYRAALAS